MSRQFIFLIPLLFCGRILSQHSVPKEYLPKYYYQNTDSILKTATAPEKALAILKKDWQHIPAATYTAESIDGMDTIMNFTPFVKCPELLVFRTEITNQLYRRFITSSSGRTVYMPDTSLWESQMDLPVYSLYYFQDAAYNNYPVVGINLNSAMVFCRWFEDSLNNILAAKGIKNLKARVTVPSETEWAGIYAVTVRQALEKKKQPWLNAYSSAPSHLKMLYGKSGFTPNFNQMRDLRGMQMKLSANPDKPPLPVPVKSSGYCGGLYGLLGNAAEWTRTNADSNLFNNKEFMINRGGTVSRMPNTTVSESSLAGYMHKPEIAREYYCVKGGSWTDEVFFLQPAAMKFRKATKSSCAVGFRPILYFVESN